MSSSPPRRSAPLRSASNFLMKTRVQLTRGVESLFGTRDENIRLLEQGLNVTTQLLDNELEIVGEEPQVARAERIVGDYLDLVRAGQVIASGEMNSFLRVVTADEGSSLRSLVESGKARNFGKKSIVPKTVNQRVYLDAIERYDLVFGIGPAGTGKTYLAVAMAVAALLAKQVTRIILTRPAVEAASASASFPEPSRKRSIPTCGPSTMPCST
jgi:phosphate starvation-inducible protein PhoH and related proteins